MDYFTVVIPGCAGPEPILPIVVMDSGLAPRNDNQY
jgi:hypothetical protein